MPEPMFFALAIVVGLIGLVWSADRFVDGSASMARALGLSPLLIGSTVVAFGTSAPEILVSLQATLEGAGDLAVGNALGSNIANIGLVLGLTALFVRLPVTKDLLFHEVPILVLVTAAAGVVLADAKISIREGQALIATIIPVMLLMLIFKLRKPSSAKHNLPEVKQLSLAKSVFWFVVGLGLLILSAKALVWGATQCAFHFGVSPLIVGLTLVAIGTSLPELATSLLGALRGHHDIALGNIIGSNIFNILVVMAIPGMLHPLSMEHAVLYRDFATMGALTVLFTFALVTAVIWRKNDTVGSIGWLTGTTLLACYGYYYFYLFQNGNGL